MKPIPQMVPSFDEHERSAINEYMLSGGWLMEHTKTREFEKKISEFTGAKYCSIMPNGTLSLSVALVALGVGVGDEVIVPDYTMVATPNSVELIGAKVVFVDIDRSTLCIDFDKLKSAITSKTKAVMIVSINGRAPSDLEEMIDYCHEKGLFVIEDAAQSLGSTHNGHHLGTFGDIGSFSFSVPKIITTGQGGALITDNDDLIEKIRKIRDFGREKHGEDHYLVKGWNMKFTDMQAVIGLEQMKKLPLRVKRKKEMGRLYCELLSGIDGVELINTDLEETSPWFYDILCRDRNGLKAYMKEKGVGTREFYPPLHSEPVYGLHGNYPVTEEISSKGLWLPSSIMLTDEEIAYVCGCIREYAAVEKRRVISHGAKIYVAGHTGLVGSAIVRSLKSKGYTNIVTRTHSELDLLDQAAVKSFFEEERPEYVFHAAAHVGGIGANSAYPADFIYQNMLIGFNIIESARLTGVKKLMNMGSSCIYPKMAAQPMREEALLSGPLEPTNDAYALAKISVIKLCTSYNKQFGTNYLSVMPTSIYGMGDTYDLERGHVLPTMLMKFHAAKTSGEDKVVLWGDGSPLREFLFADDLADAVVYLMERKNASDLRNAAGDFVNVGTGRECTIKQLADMVRSVVYADCPGRTCAIEWNTTRPDGTPRKLCDVSRLTALGWQAKTELRDGIEIAYKDYCRRNTVC